MLIYRYFLLTVLLCWSFFSRAQTSITNRQMYNYTVGDTVQWSSPVNYCAEGAKYEERVVLAKKEFTGYVIYTVKDTRKYQHSWLNLPDKIVTHDIRINDLDTAVLFTETPGYANCDYSARRDTVFTHTSLGKLVYGSVYYRGPSYACNQEGTSFFIEGIGEWYDLIFRINVDPCRFLRNLEFCHKVGEPVYGKPVIVPPAAEVLPALSIYPTLISDHVLRIDYNGSEDIQAQFYATDGQLVGEETVRPGDNAFNLNVNPGIYIVRINSSDHFNGRVSRILIYDK